MTEEPREAARNFTAGDGLQRIGDELSVVGTAGRIRVYPNSIDIDPEYKGQLSIEVLSPKVYERVQEMITAAVANLQTGFHFRGGWDSVTQYATNDAVAYQGSVYITDDGGDSGIPPTYDDGATTMPGWHLFAAEGAQGPAGKDGISEERVQQMIEDAMQSVMAYYADLRSQPPDSAGK